MAADEFPVEGEGGGAGGEAEDGSRVATDAGFDEVGGAAGEFVGGFADDDFHDEFEI